MDTERLRSLPVRYSRWEGQCVNIGDPSFPSDGKLMYAASAVPFDEQHRKRHRKLLDVDPPAGRSCDPQKAREVWREHTSKRDQLWAVALDDVRRPTYSGRDYARLTYPPLRSCPHVGGAIYVDAQYLRIAQLVVGFDRAFAGSNREKAVLLARDGFASPVALVMPLREDAVDPNDWTNADSRLNE